MRDDILVGYVMKDFYVGAVLQSAYTINNYRQLAIAEMYSWASYSLGADVYLPHSYGECDSHAGEYAYSQINVGSGNNQKKIYSSAGGLFMGVSEEVK